MSDIKLKSCPFCGSENIRLLSPSDDGVCCINYFDEIDDSPTWVHCYGCDMDFMPHTDIGAEVVEAWNTRTLANWSEDNEKH